MSKIRDSVRLPYDKKVASTGTGAIQSRRVEPGQMLVCQSLAWKNATGARGTASLRIRQSSVVYELGDQASPAANQWYFYPYEQHVNEGEQVEVSQASCIANDELSLVIIGYIEYKADVRR